MKNNSCVVLTRKFKMKILPFLLVLFVAYNCHAISDRDLYNINAPGSTSLQNGNEESRQIRLRSPIHFYSESYDSIYVSSHPCRLFARRSAPFCAIICIFRQNNDLMMMLVIHKNLFSPLFCCRLKKRRY